MQVVEAWPFQIIQIIHIAWFVITLLLIYFYISLTLYLSPKKFLLLILLDQKNENTEILKNKNENTIIPTIIFLIFAFIIIYAIFALIYTLTWTVYNDFNKKFSRVINQKLLKNYLLIDDFLIAKYIPQESNFFKSYLKQREFSKYEIKEHNSLIILYIKDKRQQPIYFSELEISEKTKHYLETFYYGCIFSIHESSFYQKDNCYMKFKDNEYYIIMYQYKNPYKSLLEYNLFKIINIHIVLYNFNKILQTIKNFVI